MHDLSQSNSRTDWVEPVKLHFVPFLTSSLLCKDVCMKTKNASKSVEKWK